MLCFRLILRSLWFLTLWIIILCSGMWVAMVMFHIIIIITINIVRGISWSIGQRFRDYPPLKGSQEVRTYS